MRGEGVFMCKFCNQEQYNPICSLKLDFGMLGKHTLDISISEEDNGMESSLVVDLSSDGDKFESGENLLYKKVKIHYCPICGEEI
jgi:hypothetical protein